ncbi:hypothetical protein MUK42_08481 [Musa troglodytarum]|uniref:Uncharacterized protein n=1 Tax=Musa troglodytarum TaxID=320322 RepID=A0A9E7LB36_9LILI|nr:hypothetical protein MUK42_08481 [Musa troglodytarum]
MVPAADQNTARPEMDFLAIEGTKPLWRPRKGPRIVQRQFNVRRRLRKERFEFNAENGLWSHKRHIKKAKPKSKHTAPLITARNIGSRFGS